MAKQGKNSNNEFLLKKKINNLNSELDAARGQGLAAKDLRGEKSFMEYLKILTAFSKRYAVLIAVSDTPCGPAFKSEHSSALMKLGIKTDLVGKYRLSYAAAINAGELLFEEIAPSITMPVEHEFSIGNCHMSLESVGYCVPRKSEANITINGKNCSANVRGINFVVLDPVTDTLIDAVTFDTYGEKFPCYRPSGRIAALNDYRDRHPEISLFCFSKPKFPTENFSSDERFLQKNNVSLGTILGNPDNPAFVLNKSFAAGGVAEVLAAPKSYHDIYGMRRFEDFHGNYVNTSDGRRITADQPKDYAHTIYLVGGCSVFGIGASDKGTIASHLQRFFNQFAPEQKIIVQNYGYYLMEGDDETDEDIDILNALPVKPNDIVVFNMPMDGNSMYVDLTQAAQRPHDYGEVFFDAAGHLTEDGYKLVAEKLFDELKNRDFGSKSKSALSPIIENIGEASELRQKTGYKGMGKKALEQLMEYKRVLCEFYNERFGIAIGSVVVNCNPFTLGHRYLIEQAAAQVDHLVVFVVQEDKSEFPFDDRLSLVDQGVADMKNVTVIPSGSFIISSLTFSDYFNKSEMQDREIDATLDVTLFAQEIAPCLNICARFVGEEPFDSVTRQYNDTMRAILPQYGIEFVEIPRRLSESNTPISASYVRKLLADHAFDEIAKIVPKTTLDYLKNR